MITFKQFLLEKEYWGKQAAGAIIKAKDTGRYLLAYRSADVFEPHTWGIWGGKIDGEESPTEAIIREIEEELGDIKLSNPPKFLWLYKDGDFKYYNYLVVVDKEFTPNLNWETEKSGWFELDKFPKPLHFGLKALLDRKILF